MSTLVCIGDGDKKTHISTAIMIAITSKAVNEQAPPAIEASVNSPGTFVYRNRSSERISTASRTRAGQSSHRPTSCTQAL